jgi:predicted transposase YbfD/YdcC
LTCGPQTSQETASYLLSTPAARFGDIVRAHWGIENGLHSVLDMTMNEVQSRNRMDHALRNHPELTDLTKDAEGWIV